jgi:hypothetical protein
MPAGGVAMFKKEIAARCRSHHLERTLLDEPHIGLEKRGSGF